jgi:transcription termination/antitermination protein NusG
MDEISSNNQSNQPEPTAEINQPLTEPVEPTTDTAQPDDQSSPLANNGDDDDNSDSEESTGEKSGAKEMEFHLNEDLLGDKKKHWYVINTYSGYEENVCQALKQRIDSMDMSHKIFDVVVPKEKKVEIKNGKKKIVEKKIFPGYVLVQMIVDEDSWYVVRNTPSVTGFIGFGSKPTPLSDEEIKNIQKRMGIEEPEFKIDLEEGESVKIIDGPFKDFDGVIAEIDKIRGKIKVLVSMFGRETPVELDALQIKKL